MQARSADSSRGSAAEGQHNRAKLGAVLRTRGSFSFLKKGPGENWRVVCWPGTPQSYKLWRELDMGLRLRLHPVGMELPKALQPEGQSSFSGSRP